MLEPLTRHPESLKRLEPSFSQQMKEGHGLWFPAYLGNFKMKLIFIYLFKL